MRPAYALIAILTIVSAAVASPVTLNVDPGQSDVTVELCAQGVCDQDTAGVTSSSFVVPSLDCLGDPTAIDLYDFDLQLDAPISLTLNFGAILGTLTANATDVALSYPTPGAPVGAVPLVAGAFLFPAVPADPSGTLMYSATGGFPGFNLCTILMNSGVPCADTIDLSTVTFDDVMLDGTVTVIGRTVKLTLNVDASGPLDPDNPNLGMLSIVGTVVAIGDVPLPDLPTFVGTLTGTLTDTDLVCESDINGNGATDGRDVAFYLDAVIAP